MSPAGKSDENLDDGARFEVRDYDLADRPPLAHALDYSSALRVIQRLHQQFWDQIEANGEGAVEASQCLSIVLISGGRSPELQYVSAVGGRR